MNTQNTDWNLLSQALPQIRIVHHVQGRLRVRLLPGIREVLPKDGGKPDQWLAKIPGVIGIRLNLAAASAVIQYDSARIQPQWWERLLQASQKDLPDLLAEVDVII